MLGKRIQLKKEMLNIQERKEDNLRESFPGMGNRTAVEALILENRKATSIVTEIKRKG